jgi:hypothetical protein
MNGVTPIAGAKAMMSSAAARRSTVTTLAATTNTINGSAFLMVGSALLVMVGLVLQVGEIGFGHFRVDNLWLVSVVASDLWNLVAARLGGPSLTEVLRYWPLILVGLGLSTMLATQENRLRRTRKGAKYGL